MGVEGVRVGVGVGLGLGVGVGMGVPTLGAAATGSTSGGTWAPARGVALDDEEGREASDEGWRGSGAEATWLGLGLGLANPKG